jgi:hypothetical protein
MWGFPRQRIKTRVRPIFRAIEDSIVTVSKDCNLAQKILSLKFNGILKLQDSSTKTIDKIHRQMLHRSNAPAASTPAPLWPGVTKRMIPRFVSTFQNACFPDSFQVLDFHSINEKILEEVA